MLPDILSFLSKLPPIPPGYVMEKNGPRVQSSLDAITLRLPNVSLEGRLQLAILLQHSHPSNYTDQELEAVLSIKLPLLDANPDVEIPTVLTPYGGMYDTKSYRVYNQVSHTGLSMAELSYLFSRSVAYCPTNVLMEAVNGY